MKELMIKEKGITLIALIVTIIVLLILAGISISLVMRKNGIIDTAKKASIATSEEYEKERISFAINSSKIEELGDLSEENLKKQLVNEFGEGKTTVTMTENGNYSIEVLDTARTYYINSNGNISQKPYLIDSVEIGDYVDYSEGNTYSYTSSANINGVEDQTFTTNNNIKWQVLEKKNNKIYLISSDVIKTDNNTEFALNGKTGYLNGVCELNNICNIYGNGVGAESARSVNCDDIIDLVCDMTGYGKHLVNWNIQNCKDKSYYDFFDKLGNPVTYIERNYQHYVLLYTVMDKESQYYKLLFITNKTPENNKSIYWSATQAFNGNEKGCWYGIFFTYYNETNLYGISGKHVYAGDGRIEKRTACIRPIVILNSNLQDNGKNENQEWKIEE